MGRHDKSGFVPTSANFAVVLSQLNAAAGSRAAGSVPEDRRNAEHRVEFTDR